MLLAESSTAVLSKTEYARCLEGEFATFGELNQNNRIYPRDLYEDALNKLMPKIQKRACLGECDHPMDYDEVRLSNVSHVITEVSVKGNKVYGKVELLKTPAGQIIDSLVEAGIPIGISSRAVGDIREVNGHEEVTSLDIITYDLVADPSFKDAVLSESTRSKLGESLKRIEKSIPLRESCGSSARGMIKRIRESLLTDSSGRVSNKQTSDQKILLASYSATVMKQSKAIVEMRSQTRDLIGENKFLREQSKLVESRLEKATTQLTETRTSLQSLSTNMTKLQDDYNRLSETTVPRDSYDKLNNEIVELRKRYAVESRGMTYSQVRGILEGATTTEEINKRLDSVKTSRTTPLLEELSRSANPSDSSKQSTTPVTSRLTTLVSRI